MGEEPVVDVELPFIRETKLLDGYSIEDREKYVYGVMEVFAKTIDGIMKIKGKIKKAKKLEALQRDLGANDGEKGAEIMVCGLYAVKMKYRPLFVKLLAVVSGINEEVFMPK